ncbi:MAG: peptidase M61, partial [Sphingomonadaceae bacterium]|nr:peptidase M61 [Sphingomonadaceae bacterium]
GIMTLDIDASDVARGIYRVKQTIPVAPGTRGLTLLYPRWLPGNHAPRGPIAELVGLQFAVNGKPVTWRRNPLEVSAFHLDLPAGARQVVASFIHSSPLRPAEGRVTMTPEMLNLQWEKMSLYPAGHYTSRIAVEPSVTLPSGWTAASALTGRTRKGGAVSWTRTDYETLVDSPVFAGAYYRQWPLGNTVQLNTVADAPGLLALDKTKLASLSRLVDEALLTFGTAPYDHYEFLVALSDRLGGIGLEHLRSSENQLEPRNFYSWKEFDWDRNVLAHELVHAWNGKYRRPARIWTPDYRTPMQDDLLWVYEGQTQFWGWVLAARSGIQSKDMVLGIIAKAAGDLAESPGRQWRSVLDTTLDPIIAARKPKPYRSLARGEDYYSEGALIWLEADQIIRAGTNGRQGLDDFARNFFSRSISNPRLNLYDLEDVLAALNRIHAHDWAGFFRERIDLPGRAAPLAGLEMAGYRLVWKAQPNPYAAARMKNERNLTLQASLGLTVNSDGQVRSPRWNGPAFNAGIVTGAKIVAVDGLAYSPEGLKQAIARAAGDKRPIDLLVRRGKRFETVSVPYFGGLRWPWLERVSEQGPAALDRLLTPRGKR